MVEASDSASKLAAHVLHPRKAFTRRVSSRRVRKLSRKLEGHCQNHRGLIAYTIGDRAADAKPAPRSKPGSETAMSGSPPVALQLAITSATNDSNAGRRGASRPRL